MLAGLAFWGRKVERGGMEVRERMTTWRMKVRNSEEDEEAIFGDVRRICLVYLEGVRGRLRLMIDRAEKAEMK